MGPGQARQATCGYLPPPCRQRRAARQDMPDKSYKSYRGLTQNPSGSDGVSVWCLWQQGNEEEVFFPLHTGLQRQLAVRGHSAKLPTFFKGRVALVAVQAVSWTLMHPAPGWHSDTVAALLIFMHLVPGCANRWVLSPQAQAPVWPYCPFDAFLPWFCSPKRKKLLVEPAAEERIGIFYTMPLLCFPHHHCAGKISELYRPRGGL